MSNKKPSTPTSPFAPLILIGIGTAWLLSNLGILPALDWSGVLRLWPLFLILGGLNLIVQQAPSALARLLTTLLAVSGLALVLGVLLFPSAVPFVGERFSAETVIDEPFSVSFDAVEAAQIRIDTGATGADIAALVDDSLLMAGTVSHSGMLDIGINDRGANRTVTFEVREAGGWSLAARPRFDPWQIGVNGSVPLDLRIDSGSGAVDIDLRGVQLSNFDLDAGSGVISAEFPNGQYDANIDLGSGASTFVFPISGDGDFEFDTASGAMLLQIPFGVMAQITVDAGSGSFSVDDRFTQIESRGDDSVWQTRGFGESPSALNITIDQGSGQISVEATGGR